MAGVKGATSAPAAAKAVAAPKAATAAAPKAAKVTTPTGADTAAVSAPQVQETTATYAPTPAPALEGDVEVIVVASISGTRDGVPWPAPGETLTLPADEAADYLRFGYVRLPE